MTLRILFTLVILAGLAAAPNAQTFRWEAGTHNDVTERVERALERARQRVGRQVRRLDQQRVREVQRSIYASDRYSAQIERQVRDSTMPAGPLTVDAGDNGGITVDAWNRNEIRVRAIVRGAARTDDRATQIANGVQVQSGGGRVSASGPDRDRREWWSVSYRINVPRKSDLELTAHNGGITITGVNGGFRSDIPLTIQGELSSRRGVPAQLGSGGPAYARPTAA